MNEVVSFSADELEPPEDFYVLESMVSDHDADGDGPLRRGAQPFAWQSVETLGQTVLTHFPDIRVAVWLLRAAMALRALEGLAEGLNAVLKVLRMRPPETLDDELKQQISLQLSWLASAGFRAQIERLPTGFPEPSDCLAGLARAGELSVPHAMRSPLVTSLQSSASCLEDIAAYCVALDVLPLPEFAPLIGTLMQARQVAEGRSVAGLDPGGSDASDDMQRLDRTAVPSMLTSRDDVRRSIDALTEYFADREPGHPAPVLLARVRRMVGADFETLMNELYQDGPKLVQLINTPRQS